MKCLIPDLPYSLYPHRYHTSDLVSAQPSEKDLGPRPPLKVQIDCSKCHV